MRLRNVKGAGQRILDNPYAIQTDGAEGGDYRGLWNQNFFHNDHPIHIEIGMGKGQFIIQMAQAHPDINYIGVEKYSSVLVRALDKREALETDNLLFLRMDAADITNFFAPGEISRIYLNFSDPWPKDRHAKRRLTSIEHLRLYEQILKKDGSLQFKTDNRPLFEFSIEQLDAAGWARESVNFDLHRHGPAPHNVMTEYEEKFYHLGTPICRLLARRPPI